MMRIWRMRRIKAKKKRSNIVGYKITSVIFEVDAQNRDGQFTVPKKYVTS